MAAREDRASAGREDPALMRLVEGGDVHAFEQLYDRYCARAYRLARSVCHEHGRAEEAVQEAFISVWRRPAIYLPKRGAVASWLMTVVHNRAIDVARRDRRHDGRRVDVDVIELHRAPDDLPARAEEREEMGHMHALLEKLPHAQRQVIVLSFYGELTHEEIARQLEIPPGTVKGRMRLGLQKLRAQAEQVAA